MLFLPLLVPSGASLLLAGVAAAGLAVAVSLAVLFRRQPWTVRGNGDAGGVPAQTAIVAGLAFTAIFVHSPFYTRSSRTR